MIFRHFKNLKHFSLTTSHEKPKAHHNTNELGPGHDKKTRHHKTKKT